MDIYHLSIPRMRESRHFVESRSMKIASFSTEGRIRTLIQKSIDPERVRIETKILGFLIGKPRFSPQCGNAQGAREGEGEEGQKRRRKKGLTSIKRFLASVLAHLYLKLLSLPVFSHVVLLYFSRYNSVWFSSTITATSPSPATSLFLPPLFNRQSFFSYHLFIATNLSLSTKPPVMHLSYPPTSTSAHHISNEFSLLMTV